MGLHSSLAGEHDPRPLALQVAQVAAEVGAHVAAAHLGDGLREVVQHALRRQRAGGKQPVAPLVIDPRLAPRRRRRAPLSPSPSALVTA